MFEGPQIVVYVQALGLKDLRLVPQHIICQPQSMQGLSCQVWAECLHALFGRSPETDDILTSSLGRFGIWGLRSIWGLRVCRLQSQIKHSNESLSDALAQ